MIISLFGPDGVGKSTVTRELSEHGMTVFSGTDVASWPDQSWHNALTFTGIDETTLDKDEHFIEKIVRVHKLAGQLASEHETVVIDSDPLHKTLIHDYLRSMHDEDKAAEVMSKRFTIFKNITGYGDQTPLVHTFFQISDSLDVDAQAKQLHERVVGRGEIAYFDPKDLQGSIDRIRACNVLKRILEKS